MSSHPASVQIRDAKITDIPAIVRLFFDTVHLVNCRDYTPAQIHAWAPQIPDEILWAERLNNKLVFVAENHDTILGFAELETGGYIDCFYCHHAYQGQGIGKALLQHIEQTAIAQPTTRLCTNASITARPFFERMGFRVLHENQVVRNGVTLINFSMEKFLKDEG